jgi:hypothetical protein
MRILRREMKAEPGEPESTIDELARRRQSAEKSAQPHEEKET